MQKIRIAVCGTGFWAGEVHLPVYAAHDRFELVGVYGRNGERTAELAAPHGGRAFATFEDMLAEVDAVSFAVPPQVQARLAVQAAEAGKALMLEKPAATALADADALVAAVEGNGVAATVYLPRLHSQPIRDLIRQAKELGAVEGSASFQSGALLPGSPYAGSAWRQDEHGVLWDVGPHALTVLGTVFGPVRRVSASNPRQALIECLFEHEGGARSTARLDLRDEIADGIRERYGFSRDGRSVEVEAPKPDRRGFFAEAAADFAGLVAEGRSDLGFSRHMVAVLEAAARSIGSGAPSTVAA